MNFIIEQFIIVYSPEDKKVSFSLLSFFSILYYYIYIYISIYNLSSKLNIYIIYVLLLDPLSQLN
jgi:hypothetical protein